MQYARIFIQGLIMWMLMYAFVDIPFFLSTIRMQCVCSKARRRSRRRRKRKKIYIDTACMLGPNPEPLLLLDWMPCYTLMAWNRIAFTGEWEAKNIRALSTIRIIHGMELLSVDAITLIRLLLFFSRPHFVHYIIQVMSVID